MKKIVSKRQVLVIITDATMSLIAWAVSYLVRFNFELPGEYHQGMLSAVPVVVGIQTTVFWFFGIHSAFWRFLGIIDLRNLIISTGLSTSLISLILFFLERGAYVPRTVLLLYALIFAGLACGVRLIYRYVKERGRFVLQGKVKEPVLVLGAGVAGEKLIRQLEGSSTWYVAGLLDDDDAKLGGYIHGVKVLGNLTQLDVIAKSLGIRQIIMALPSVNHKVRQRVSVICESAGLEILTVPAIDDLVAGASSVGDVRELELDDLLGRNPVHLDAEAIKDYIEGKIVMVTGAGGSIGSELCRQLARFTPKLLIFWEMSEYGLYLIETEFRDNYPAIAFESVIGDVKSKSRVTEILYKYQPNLILHAAAYKHVPLMESGNVREAFNNNVYGTLNLARVAKSMSVENFILISTDKAVNPSNVMGATKRLAEMICELLEQTHSSKTRFIITRFGNVIGSTGSVIPRFREQIKFGGPVTVTHPEIQRYFMSISEAAQLVLQAAILVNEGTIFVLDMGSPMKIADVASELIRLSGKTEQEIEITYTGLRPGEKMTEELLAAGEKLIDTEHPKLKVALSRQVDDQLIDDLEEWFDDFKTADEHSIKNKLKGWVSEYRLNE